MIVIVPTRGRPENVVRQQAAVTAAGTSLADFVYVIDADDPKAVEYCRLGLSRLDVLDGRGGGGMVPALNFAARQYSDIYDAVGFMGDDHLPRTPRWDRRIIGALNEDWSAPHVVYGNDLLQGANLATAAFLDSRTVKALGYMAPPDLHHLYADNFWMELGQRLGGLTYLDDVVIEHMHPIANKAAWDAEYTRVNTSDMDTADRRAWETYRDFGDMASAVARVRRAG